MVHFNESNRPEGQCDMRISIRGDRTLDSTLIELAKLRFGTALGRFATRIHSLVIRIGDINGPKGGADKRCVVQVRLTSPRRIAIIEDIDPSAAAAISRAANRAGRTVARLVATHRDRHFLEAR